MHFRGLPKVFFLTVCILSLGLATACGGEAENQQDSGGAEQTQEQGGQDGQNQGRTGQTGGEQPEIKIALGTIETIDAENRRLTLQPVKGESQTFIVAPRATITVDGRQAELASIEEQQQAQIRYVDRNERNRARTVTVFSDSGGTG